MLKLANSLVRYITISAGTTPVDPLSLNPYLYFDGSENVTTAGGAVSSWSERTAGTNQLDRTLAQGTAGYQPDNATENSIDFDGSDDRLAFDVAVAQVGILITATSNGIFAYEVDADSVDEITALGFETGYFQNLDLFAMVLLPTTVTDAELEGVVLWLDENTNATKNPTGSLEYYWRGRTDLVTPKFSGIDFSGVTSFRFSWYPCTGLTSFPAINMSAGTSFYATWESCTSLASMPAIALTAGTDFTNAWKSCTALTSFLATGLDSGAIFTQAWRNCTSLTSMPAIPLTAGTNFQSAWDGCSSLTSFLATGLDSGTIFSTAWYNCTALTTFPAIPFTAGTTFTRAWHNCTSLTSFLATDFTAGVTFSQAWENVESLTTFPAIAFPSSATNFSYAWRYCDGMTTFLATGLDSGTTFLQAWYLDTALTEMPAIPLTAGLNFTSAWSGCTSLTSFLATGLDSGTNFTAAWANCTSLATFPAIPLTAGLNFTSAWSGCLALTSFPVLDLSAGTNFTSTWYNCNHMVSFGACNMNAGTDFQSAWEWGVALTTFPAGVFDDWNPASIATDCFLNTWRHSNVLTEQSVENILLSISASGQWATSTGTSSGTVLAGKEITIGGSNPNVNVDNLSASNRAACTALQSRGWEVVINGSIVDEYSVNFNGTDEYVATGLTPDFIHTGATLSYWVKMDNFTGFQVMGCFTSGEPTTYFYLGFYGTNINWGVHSTYKNSVDVSSYVSVGSWHHLCMVATGGAVTVYIDGVSRDTGTYTPAEASNPTSPLAIGAVAGPSIVDPMEGDIDEVAIWDEALDADAVTAVYNSSQPINLSKAKGNYDNEGDLVSWWRMGDNDGGAGLLVTDAAGTATNALFLPAVAGNYASVPDAADLDGFGDFTLQVDDVTLPDWTPSSSKSLFNKWEQSPNQLSFSIDLATDGKLYLVLSFNGTSSTSYVSTVATGVSDGATASIRILRTGSDIKFYVDTGSGFAQLGGTVSAVDTALADTTALVLVGAILAGGTAQPVIGSIGRARIWSDATQTTNVLDINFALANKGVTSFTATSGQEVTIHSTAIADPAVIRGTTDGVLVNTPTFVVDTPPNYSNYALEFNGSDEYGTMSVAALDDTFTVSAWVKFDAGSSGNNYIISFGASGTRSHFSLARYGSTGAIYVYDGSVLVGTKVLPLGEWFHVAGVVQPTTDRLKLYINGIADTIAQPAGDFDIDASTGAVARYQVGAANYLDAQIDEVAIFSSALTSAQINDIYNGGVPAALTSLSPLNWWRMGEDNSGAGSTITDMGSGSDNLTLYNTPTYVRTTPIENAVYNYRSIEFNGTDEYADGGTGLGDALGDNYAGSLTVSLWFKADVTSGNDGLFNIGSFAGSQGEFQISLQGNILYFTLNGNGWIREVAFTDTASWHHVACVYTTGSEANTKMYLDGIAVGTGGASFPAAADMDFAGLKTIIGAYYSSSYPFDGNIDEVGVFTRALSASDITAIYNGGLPFDISEFNPESWWRMGEGDAEGTTITDLGFTDFDDIPELVVADPYTAARWAASSGNTETFVAGESVRFDRPASGGSSQGGVTYFILNAIGCLAENLTPNTTYEVSFLLESDDDNIGADILGSAWAGHTYSTTGAGIKTMYLHYVSGNPYIIFFNLDNSKYVKLSGLTVKSVNGNPLTLVNTPTWSTDSP